ncbi:uncharacterized protein LOC108681700 [Hyalella azteca]|uniref:Uncharacterized protein LOC108681700 n=1 Tax=Hyalella azteca TaxID=294128 RepID=A0A8B7PJS6_HYAAZ|nr:uncharacterized protein LOC108681700 [Hyalella azteca]
MYRMLVAIFFPLMALSSAAMASLEHQPEPLSIFQDTNTFYKIKPDTSIREQHSHQYFPTNKFDDEEYYYSEDVTHHLDEFKEEDYTEVTVPYVESNTVENNTNESIEASRNEGYMSYLPSLPDVASNWKTTLITLIDTVHKATKIYQSKRQELSANLDGNKTDRASKSHSSVPTSLVSLILNPRSFDELVEVGRSAHSEDEVLEGLASVVLKAEGRYGSSLTLDPVTVIALLTLAAYLIRAVYQILITNNNGRSLDYEYPSQLHAALAGPAAPEKLAQIAEFITRYDHTRHARSPEEDQQINSLDIVDAVANNSVLSAPGSVAALLKLGREGHDGCVRLYTCEHLGTKSVFSYSFDQFIIAGMGLYLSPTDRWSWPDPADYLAGPVDHCASYRGQCKQEAMTEAVHMRDLFTQTFTKLFHFLATARKARRQSSARQASAPSNSDN